MNVNPPGLRRLLCLLVIWSVTGLSVGFADPVQPDSTPFLLRTLPTNGAVIGGVAWHDGELWTVDQNGVVRRVDPETGGVLETVHTGFVTHNGLGSDGSTLWMSYDPGGNTRFRSILPAGGSLQTPTVGARDLTSRGGHLWYADFDEGKVVEMTTSGDLVDQFDSPFGFAASGLEWDGQHLLHAKHDGNLLLLIDPVTHTVTDTIDLGAIGVKTGGGLAWDGERLYIADFDEIYIVAFNLPGVPLDGVPFIAAEFEFPVNEVGGVAWHDGDLWAATQLGVVGRVDRDEGTLSDPIFTGLTTHNGLGSTGETLWMSHDPDGSTSLVPVIPSGPSIDTPTSAARDLTSINGNLWYADFNAASIVETTTSGTLARQFDSPLGFGAQGLEWDGEHLIHSVHDGDELVLIDPDTESVEATLDLSPLGITIAGGLAWDGRLLWVADFDRIYGLGFFSPDRLAQTAFEDNFEDSVFTERNWTQQFDVADQDERWFVSAGGTFVGDSVSTDTFILPDGTAAFANRLGCGALQEGDDAGITLYAPDNILMRFRMRAINPGQHETPGVYGASVLTDPTHPSRYPGLIVGINDNVVGPDNSFIVRFNGIDEGTVERVTFLAGSGLPAGFSHDEWHDYEVLVRDGEIRFSIDGAVQDSTVIPLLADDSPIQQGALGLTMNVDYLIEYDDVFVLGQQICEINTPEGEDVEIDLAQGVTMSFDTVTSGGTSTVIRSQDPPEPVPDSLEVSFLGEYYDISTTAEFEGSVLLTFDYDGSTLTEEEESRLNVLHFDEATGSWEDITVRPVDTAHDRIQALTDSFSTFGIALPNLTATFLQPIGPGTSSAAPAGPYKLKRTVPIKFRLLDASGVPVSDETAMGLDPRLRIILERETEAGEPVDPGDNPGDTGSSFRYDEKDDLFIFNLKTKGGAWSADRVYRAEVLIGGLVNGTAFFALK